MGSKNKKKNNSGENGTGKNQTIDDPRFSKAHFDPRFRLAKHHKAKVAIDSRFDGVFTDKRFATSSAPVDKRGKPKKSSENSLRRYYHLEEEEDAKKVKNAMKKREKEKEESESESEGDEKAVAKLSESSASDSESESDGSSAETSSTGSSDDEDEADDEVDDSVEVENVAVIEKETHRLAVVNMDWSQVKAVDLYVMLSSCLPKDSNGRQIMSVSVYPSEFGLKRMEEEAVHGPIALFEDEKKKKIDDDYDDDDDEEDANDEDEKKKKIDSEDANDDNVEDDDDKDDNDSDDEQNDDDLDVDEIDDLDADEMDDLDDDEIDDLDDSDDDDDDGDEIDTEKVRAYEKSKLRYYYAVVECDSVATADYLYKTCDGVEFERSSNVLDLRFIPDSMEFKHPPRDVATEAPADYEGLDFHTRALQQSNAVLSWDDDEPHRVKTLRRKFNENQLAELELKEFLASDESESDEDENDDQDPLEKRKKKHEKYRNLLLSGDGSEREDEDDDEGHDMEVTFNTGLEEISKKILEKKDKGSESVWEAYLRKKKEKKKARKHRSKNSSDDDSDESDDPVSVAQTDDFFEEDPSVNKSKKVAQGKKKREEKKLVEDKESEASRAELELLLADENGADKKLKGYKIKQKKAKGKKGEEVPDEAKLPTVDLDDPRFSALFNNPGFALDPTEPQFQRSATYFRQLAQKQHKNLKEEADVVPIESSAQKEEKHSIGASQKDRHELSSIVKSLKLKSQQLPLPKDKMKSNGSTSEKKKRKLSSTDGTMKKKARE